MSSCPPPKALQLQESGWVPVAVLNKLLQAETQAILEEANENLISVRIVYHLLVELNERRDVLGDKPCARVIDELVPSLQNDDNSIIFELGQRYRDHLIRAFMVPIEEFSPPSLPSSPPTPYATLEDMIKDFVEATGKDYETSRRKAMARDGFRCMITGALDWISREQNAELQNEQWLLENMPVNVAMTPILGGLATQEVGEENAGTDHTAMEILRQFGLDVGGIYEVQNVLSLRFDLHFNFGILELWFNGTNEPDCYEVCTSNPGMEHFIRTSSTHPKTRTNQARPKTSQFGTTILVNFSSDCEGVPPPDPKLLALHATCAQVALSSGAATFPDRLDRDVEALTSEIRI